MRRGFPSARREPGTGQAGCQIARTPAAWRHLPARRTLRAKTDFLRAHAAAPVHLARDRDLPRRAAARWWSRSAPTSSTARPAFWAPTGSARRSSPTRRRRAPTSWSRRPSTSAWPSITWAFLAPSRCGPRPSSPRSATGSARWPGTASRGSIFLNGHGGNVASIEAAFSELYAEASFARRPRRLRAEAAQLVGPSRRLSAGPAASSRPATAAMPRRRRSPSPSGPIRTRSRPPTTRRRSPAPARSARPSTSAPAIPTGGWAPIPARPRRKRAASWSAGRAGPDRGGGRLLGRARAGGAG